MVEIDGYGDEGEGGERERERERDVEGEDRKLREVNELSEVLRL